MGEGLLRMTLRGLFTNASKFVNKYVGLFVYYHKKLKKELDVRKVIWD